MAEELEYSLTFCLYVDRRLTACGRFNKYIIVQIWQADNHLVETPDSFDIFVVRVHIR